MRAAIVNLSLTQKKNRIDAGYFLGNDKDEAFRKAELNLRRAIATYRRTLRELNEAKVRTAKLAAEGLVTPLAGEFHLP